jgi:ribosomal protein L18
MPFHRSVSKTIAVTTIVLGALPMASLPAFAGWGDSITNAISGDSKQETSKVSVEDLQKQLTSLHVRFSNSMREMLIAQALTAAALGDQARADTLESEAKSLQGKNDLKTVSRAIEISETAAQENQKKIDEAGTIDDAAKAKLTAAAVHYALGLADASKLPKEYSAWLGTAQGKANEVRGNPVAAAGMSGFLSDVSDVASVTSSLPDLITAWYDSTKSFLKYAKGNSVKTGSLEKVI